MKKSKSNILWMFIPIISLLGCLSNSTIIKSNIFNHKCLCDSLYVENYNFNFEDDSAIYSVMKKEPFEFQLFADKKFVSINGTNYYYFLAGLNVDTIGLIEISNNGYLFKKDINGNNALLFDFNAKLNDCWEINEEGYFKDYKICLKEIKYNSVLKDSVYSFSYDYKGFKFPNGYYFVNFEVSQYYGIVGYSFDNGVRCVSSAPAPSDL